MICHESSPFTGMQTQGNFEVSQLTSCTFARAARIPSAASTISSLLLVLDSSSSVSIMLPARSAAVSWIIIQNLQNKIIKTGIFSIQNIFHKYVSLFR